jgi:glucan 1,3-beta-glucosidase
MVVDGGKVLATQNNNPGSWGAIVAGVLTHSGITAHKLLSRLPGQVAQAFEA